MKENHMKILTIDGGGAKGIHSLGILFEIEKKLGAPLCDHFDYFYGCSTGAIIAAALALGKEVAFLKRLYVEEIPDVMKPICASKRSSRLKKVLAKEFGKYTVDDFKKNIAIVATSLDEKTPKIFKKHVEAALGRKSSFEPFFGCTIVDALLSSCAAIPFFKQTVVAHGDDITKFNLLDGGFCANNPTLFAAIDALNAFKKNPQEISILNIGTGDFPSSKLIEFPFSEFVTNILDINTNTINIIVKQLLKDINILRISGVSTDTSHKTHFLEKDTGKLEKLFILGQTAFGDAETQFEKFCS